MWNIIGHEWAIEQLQTSISNATDAHAYLISGMAGIGKALVALRFAQALNCEQATGAPCLSCRTCRRIERGNHPDLRIAGMASQAAGLKADEAARQKELKIGTVREWQRDLTLRPYEARRRIFILHDAERLNEEASNAMLKTLEEPPPYVTLILVANSTELLPTIVSRCRVLRLRPLPRRQVAAALEARGVTKDDAAMLAAWSGGRIGWAFQLVEQPDAVARRDEQLDTLLNLQGSSLSAGMRWAEQRAKEYRSGEQETVFAWLELWQGWWRDMLLTAAGCPEGIVNTDRRDQLAQLAKGQSLAQIHAMATRIGQAAQHLRENGNPQLVLEHVVLQVPR
ncbi:DNA polymerase III subunit delta' [Candidatus Viridilinea mediisalina]|uniref:DNA polymerase III subunit delta' n=1 Tax=Candidatus Viridilinea mediisalina TaxID=2024553 RepID=A0A2A6RIA7_9CHLR|nr:DNA polymerase III subunit delta' [Candidatus Viridilinea mediisalina]PDW02864.1 DNA polymerase III subunit delta' [Candidatus Viridilinea mediisalina]